MTLTASSETQSLEFPPARWLLTVGVVLVVGVLLLGARIQSVVGPTRGDAALQRHLLTAIAAPRSKWRDITDVGSEIPVVLAVVVLMAWAASKRDWPALCVAVLGPASALFLTEYVLKPLVDRTAPNGALSYPSGHSTVVAALVTTALLFVYRYLGPVAAAIWSPYAAAVIAAMGIAVVAIRWHYVTDAVGGVALGIGVACLVAAAGDRLASRTERTASRT